MLVKMETFWRKSRKLSGTEDQKSDSDKYRPSENQTYEKEGFKVGVVPIIYYKNTSLEKAIDRLFVEADRAYRDGTNILILSDRGVDENHVAIPSLLAVSAMQQHLIQTKKRTAVAMIPRVVSRVRSTILQHCLVTVPVPSTHIWRRIRLSSW